MSRTMIKRTATGLADVATTGALVLAVPGMAQAKQFESGNSDR